MRISKRDGGAKGSDSDMDISEDEADGEKNLITVNGKNSKKNTKNAKNPVNSVADQGFRRRGPGVTTAEMGGGYTAVFEKFFAKYYMKMKEIGPVEVACGLGRYWYFLICLKQLATAEFLSFFKILNCYICRKAPVRGHIRRGRWRNRL